MIDHERYRLLAAARLDDDVAGPAAAELERHLATCAECRAFTTRMERDQVQLSVMPAVPVAPRVQQTILRATHGDMPRRSWRRLAAVALLPIVLIGGALAVGSQQRAPEPSPSPSPSPSVEASPSLGPSSGFSEPTTIGLDGELRAIDTADLDGDGDLDLVVADLKDDGPLHVLLGDGDGQFGGHSGYFAEHPHSVELADLDLDGVPDAAVGNPGCTCVGVLFGAGDGGFEAFTRINAGLQPRELAVVDVNGDRWQDLVAPNASSDNISLHIGTGSRRFETPVMLANGPGPWSIAVGDFDADGWQDLLVGDQEAVTVYWGEGGSFRRHLALRDFGAPAQVVAGDIDGDGHDDVAVRSADREVVTVGIYNPRGPFFAPLELRSPRVGLELMGAIELADVSNDGLLDLIVGSGDGPELVVYFGDGGGGFGEPLELMVGNGPVDVAVGDFDGDGRNDVATVNFAGESLTILLQR